MVKMLEEVVPPGDQCQLVDFVDALSTLLTLATNPVSEMKENYKMNSTSLHIKPNLS
jgi:hypothetical protein